MVLFLKLLNLEKASKNENVEKAKRLQNIVIAGGVPTGVELAGRIAEMGAIVLPQKKGLMTHRFLYSFLVFKNVETPSNKGFQRLNS